MAAYPIILTPDDNGTFLVTSNVFPELTTFGESRQKALDQGAKALEEAIAARMAGSQEIPPYSDYVTAGRDYVFLDTLTAIKLSLYWTLNQRGVTRAELARRLDWHREQVDRLFRIGHASRLDQLEAAFKALGHKIDLKVVVQAA